MKAQVAVQLDKAKLIYAFIIQVNKHITRITDTQSLFSNVCQLALEFGSFKLAWVSLFDGDKRLTLAGECGATAKDIHLFDQALLAASGHMGAVRRTGKYRLSNDMLHDAKFEKWKPFAEHFGLNACMIIPVKKKDVTIGTFTLCATEAGFFNAEEVSLLEELARDISFGLDLLENQGIQQETQQLLLTNERKYRNTLDSLLEGVQILDFNWRYLYVNGSALKFGPYLREELLGSTLMDMYPQVIGSELFKAMSKCMDVRVAVHLEASFDFPKGTKRFFEWSIDPTPEGISILSVDRTDARASLAMIENNEMRFQKLIAGSDDMITLSNLAGEILYGSASIEKIFGYAQADLPEMMALDFVHEDDVAVFLKNRKRVVDQPGSSYYSQLRLRHKSGAYIWCEVTLTNRLQEEGINALVANFRDISDQQRALLAQIETNNLISTIYAASLDAVIIMDSGGLIAKWDGKSEALFGWSEAEVLGKNLSATIIPERFRDAHGAGLKHYHHTGHGPLLGKTAEVRALRSDGSEFDVSLSISPSQINGQTHFIGFIRDISEKKIAQQQLEFDKHNLNALINNTSDLMWSVDTALKLITFNLPFFQAIEMLLGKKAFKGDDVLLFMGSAEQLDRFKGYYIRALSGEHFSKIEYIAAPVETWSEISFYPIRQEGTVIGTACHSRDITQLKRSELKLINDERRLKEAQQIARLGSWVMSFKTSISCWSEEACAIYGLSAEQNEHTYADWLTYVHPEDLEKVVMENEEARKSFGETDLNYRLVLKDGSVKHIRSRSKFEFDEHGKTVGLHGTFHDVTQEKLSELSLKASEAKYRQIIETSQEGIWQVDEYNNSVFVNKRLCELFGYSLSEMLTLNTFDLLDGDGKVAIQAKIERRKIGISEDFEQAYIHKNGQRIWANVSATPIFDDKGIYRGAVAMFTDITEGKLAQMEREKMTEDLIQRNKDLEQFTYIVSHNLRAPIANIIGSAALMKDELQVQGDALTLMQGIFSSAARLDGVVRDLNDILKVKSQIDEAKIPVQFSVLIEDIKGSLQQLIDQSGIDIGYDFSEINQSTTVRSYLYSIFYNLIANGIQYRRPGVVCSICIKSRIKGGKIQIRFCDNGLGIDLKRHGGELFGLYKRFHMHVEGKGIGLFMVKAQSEALSGSISVQSKAGKGSIFTIELPV